MLEEKERKKKMLKINKWMLIVLYKNGDTVYGKKRFDSEQKAHDYFSWTKVHYEKHHKRISTYLAVPVKQ